MQFLFFLTVPYSLNINTKMVFQLLFLKNGNNFVRIYLLSVNKLPCIPCMLSVLRITKFVLSHAHITTTCSIQIPNILKRLLLNNECVEPSAGHFNKLLGPMYCTVFKNILHQAKCFHNFM